LDANFRTQEGYGSEAAKGRKKAHSDIAVGIRIFEVSGGGRGRHILKRPQKVRASDART